MNGHAPNGSASPRTNYHDVIIIGAGISGINAAYRVQEHLPGSTYTILEGREHLGGTWDLFKYPGIRSDSDLYTFGFSFNIWHKPNPIATGDAILDYVNSTVRKFGMDQHIRLQHRVLRANWSSDEQQWMLEVDNNGQRKIFYARFVILGTGYYNYEKPLEADIPGLDNFKGKVVHPQFWPTYLDYAGKKIIIIGSGATAITLLPALAEKAANVTMLQRSPSYILALPQRKPSDPPTWSEWLFPSWISQKLTRWRFIVQPNLFYLFCRRFPNAAKKLLMGRAKKLLPKDFPMDPHFNPRYNVWDQRLCLCPDGDFFEAFKTGRADVVTAKIKTVTEDGIELEDGSKLTADIIITATGLNMQFGGKIAFAVDKEPVHVPDHYMWRNTLLTGVPNLFFVIGYTNASWTLGADACARLVMRLINLMNKEGYSSAAPQITEEEQKHETRALGLNSTYIMKGLDKLPKNTEQAPWRPRDNYLKDQWEAEYADLKKGLVFGRARE